MKLSEKILSQSGIVPLAIDEEFEQVPKWNKYFFSNKGRLLRRKDDGSYYIVKPSITKGGYFSYTLSKPARKYNGKKVKDRNGLTKRNSWCVTANRLVCEMFVKYNPYENRYNYSMENLDTHHKDHNRQNNDYRNLMWLANGKDGTRADHQFVNSIKKIALYNCQSWKYHTFKDIERLCRRIDFDILELIDTLKDQETPKIKDGEWTTYIVGDFYVGVQYYKKNDKRKRGNL